MQYAKTLLGVSLVFGSFTLQAEPLTSMETIKDSRPNAEMQVAQSSDADNSAQLKKMKAASAHQPKADAENGTYEIPLSDYNNGGHFGN